MAELQVPDPVKLFAALLWSERDVLPNVLASMEELWGEIDYQGPDHPFDVTDYYEKEMGKGLQRRLLSFSKLIPPQEIVSAKLSAMEVEDALRGPSGRRVNLDVGYLDDHKVVLASVKRAGQKVYLGQGVYVDLMFRYRKGGFSSFEWTFPDFRDGRYERELLEIRRRYLAWLRSRVLPE